uniref:G-protein coupled receptors family 1 profile domain-containing protein n=1 Tax=Romanomermis culicivorax TaxID=13658 RepID=A0A915IWX8_ROMCU
MCEIGGNINLADNSTFYQFISDVNQFYMSLHPYLSILICILGVMMNSASIVVLTRPCMIVSPINCLLTAVAICDVVTMMSCFNFAVRMVTFGDCLAKYTKEWIITLLIHSNVTVVGHTVSIWLTVFMAIVRAFTVQSTGAHSAQAGNERRASPLGLRISVSVFLAVVLLNLPSYLTFAVRQEPMVWRCPAAENPALAAKYPDAYNNKGSSIRHQHPNSTIFRYLVHNAVVTDLARRNNCLILKFTFWIQGALFKFVPCVLLSIFIGVLVCILTR